MLHVSQLEPALTERDVILRDAFVGEYLKDFNSYQACLRLGFQPTYATNWSHTLFNCGYVQRKLTHMMSIPASSPEQDALDRALVETTLRNVMHRGSDSARVSAAAKFMVLKGWDNATDNGSGESEELAEAFKRLAQELPT